MARKSHANRKKGPTLRLTMIGAGHYYEAVKMYGNNNLLIKTEELQAIVESLYSEEEFERLLVAYRITKKD